MMKRLLIVMIALSSFIIFDNSKAGTLKDEYELKERCGKQAQMWFKHNYGDSSHVGYVNHFNSRMNTCLVLVNTFYERDKNEKGSKPSTDIRLIDINEQKEYGGFFVEWGHSPTECNVDNKPCRSENEWKALIKPYMEE